MRSLAIVPLSAALVLLVAPAANAAEVPPTLRSELGQELTTGDAIAEPSCANAMEHAAQMGLPAAPGDAAGDGRLNFVWRLSEHGVLFQTDEFDQAQLTSRTTSLVTGLGNYTVRLSLPAHYEHFFFTVEGGVRVEGCAPAPNESPCHLQDYRRRSPGLFPAWIPPSADRQRSRGPKQDRRDQDLISIRRNEWVSKSWRNIQDLVRHTGRLFGRVRKTWGTQSLIRLPPI